jgi:glycosyltransferase involved in cell wall biosynthesis
MVRRLPSRIRRAASQTPVRERRGARVAFYGPLPPAPTGIASYDAAVLAGLDRIGFTRRIPVDPVWPVGFRDIAAASDYPLGVFQMGNNATLHLAIYRAFWRARGLLVLHDLAFDDFVRALLAEADPLGVMAVREALAARAPVALDEGEPLRTPWCAAAARRARGIVVHSGFGRRYLEEVGCRTPIFVVPHPSVEDPAALAGAAPAAAELRAAAEARGARHLVVAPGDVNAAKQLDALVAAAGRLDPSVHVAIVGRRIPGYDIEPVLEAAAMGERVSFHHDVSDGTFRAWLLAADVIVDLRHPHRGEVSGTLIRAQQAGKPAVVSAVGTYLEAPGGTAVHVAAGATDSTELAAAIRDLLDDPERRSRMGEVAKGHIDRLRRTEAVAHGYAEAMDATLQIATDPAEAVGAAWARRLAELGMTEDLVRAGHGVAYVRALRDFTPSPQGLPGMR